MQGGVDSTYIHGVRVIGSADHGPAKAFVFDIYDSVTLGALSHENAFNERE